MNGDLRQKSDYIGKNEIGEIMATLNTMANNLAEMIQEITENSHSLEASQQTKR